MWLIAMLLGGRMRSILALSLLLIIPTIPALAADTTPGALRIGLDHSFRHSTILLISCEHPFSLTDAPTHRQPVQTPINVSAVSLAHL